ncbi:hypothetical protein EMCG_01470 [[Emmonsia] crescens]|uniref:glucan endo-1,3-beta-D-glucosidase n=1 Tax=[Emmonsia] crescens TaxID=73230 RepID=A0A0G2I0T9_9EURO|nr:hypothetical protein EMCG_01470 [Emmonsia crescens UAMH 3008]
MYYLLTVGIFISAVSAQACDGTAQNIRGSWYCSAVDSIIYANFDFSGSYNEITHMKNGSCSSHPKIYSGSLAPLNKEVCILEVVLNEARRGKKNNVSWHFRGPLHLKQFAAYALSFDKYQNNNEKWNRLAYYNAVMMKADGLTFLNHHGGDESGVFDYELGNSLSYASKDGHRGAKNSQVLADRMIPDNKEIIIMSNKKCRGSDCGVVRKGTIAYHGFSGKSKIFLMELSMPLTGKRGWNEDMPAAWILNADIPRTLQYGKAECSCWASGCGELDVLEILDAGNVRAKSSLHSSISGSDSNYFHRPVNKSIKVAIVFNTLTSSVHIKILNDSVVFKLSLLKADVNNLLSEGAFSSIFTLPS